MGIFNKDKSQAIRTYPSRGGKKEILEYWLPKKYLSVKIKYTLTKTTVSTIVQEDIAVPTEAETGKPAKINTETKRQQKLSREGILQRKTETIYSVAIKDDIVIKEIIVPDDQSWFLDISDLDKKAKSFSFSLSASEQGVMTGINSDQTPATAQIIAGAMGFVTKIISGIAGGIAGVADEAPPSEEPKHSPFKDDLIQSTEQMVILENLIDFSKPEIEFTLPVDDEKFRTEAPKVSIRMEGLDNSKLDNPDLQVGSDGVDGIVFRIPKKIKLSIVIENHNFVKKATIFEGLIYVPQHGRLTNLPLPINDGQESISVVMNIFSGQITKFEHKQVSVVEAVFKNINESSKGLSDAVLELKKANEGRNKDKSTQEEIEKLTLENSLLQQQILKEQRRKELDLLRV